MHHFPVAFFFALVVADSSAVPYASGQSGQGYRFVEDTVVRPTQLFDASKFDSVTAVSLRTIFDSATADGLPTTPLLNMALHGAARRFPGGRILQVVRAHAAAMMDARRVLGEKATATELDAAATAMRSGVDGGTLSLLSKARPGMAIIKPLVVLTDLINRGVPFSVANDAVVTISRLPRSDDALDTMQNLVARNAARGGPTMAVEALQRYLRDTVAAHAARSPAGSVIREPDR